MNLSVSPVLDQFLGDEAELIAQLTRRAALTDRERADISASAAGLVDAVRGGSEPGVMESFLAEYGLTTEEGVAMMCLAEALLRVPDDTTVDELIRDKIAPHDWASHVGDSGSILINASTWALLLTGKVLDDSDPGVVGVLHGVIRRLGEPVVRNAARHAMQEMGAQFVLGETIEQATQRGAAMVARGYTYSYDMLGEAARTQEDARRYFDAYANAIDALGEQSRSDDLRANPGISVKLSALHPRYETVQARHTVPQLSASLLALARQAQSAGVGLNVDAEEANRLDISLEVIRSVLADDALPAWDGFGVVVQAYGKRAAAVIDRLYQWSGELDRRLMVRLVKGAYWDTEVKLAQVLGLNGYPVFTSKSATDISYIGCAQQLLAYRDRLYPQFATHNAHTMAAVLHMAGDDRHDFEFQRLHGMGDALHDIILREYGTRCRIYAPVGAHQDLLAYLVRRLLENGANSSFVNQIVDLSVSAQDIAADPFEKLSSSRDGPALTLPVQIYEPERRNSVGFDINHPGQLRLLHDQRAPFMAPYQWHLQTEKSANPPVQIHSPAAPDDTVGSVNALNPADASALVAGSLHAFDAWHRVPAQARSQCLERTADLLEASRGEILALLAREAGKTLGDAIAELREAVDFLRYYAARAPQLMRLRDPRGVIVCISPWNFPLAIFTGQIAAALATGNTVIAKPAEQTPLIAHRIVSWFHEAGIEPAVLQLAVGEGETVGAALTAQPEIAGVCFTGSTWVARIIEKQLALTANPDAMLVAETGGLNAMIVDSTALNEQAVRDIVASAFQSTGQRCSALRMLYVQREKYDELITMLTGAMHALRIGDPLDESTDVGPLIDQAAHSEIAAYCQQHRDQIIARTDASDVHTDGWFVPPTLIRVDGIAALEKEIFGPILHVAPFEADALDDVIKAINDSGYALTFGLHTRIDARAEHVINAIHAGNIYINRNQIGAVVGSQPFGGDDLSGTGPKAGGPHYLLRFTRALEQPMPVVSRTANEPVIELSVQQIEQSFDSLNDAANRWAEARDRIGVLRSVLRGRAPNAMAAAAAMDMGPVLLPGPTGESNRLSLHPIGRILCLGQESEQLLADVVQALRAGNAVLAIGPTATEAVSFLQVPGVPLIVLDGRLDPSGLTGLSVDGLAIGPMHPDASQIRRALAARTGPITRLVTQPIDPVRFVREKAVCIDTTAAGGNAALLAGMP